MVSFFCAPKSKVITLADGMPIWKCLLVAIASNLESIALGSLISSDVIQWTGSSSRSISFLWNQTAWNQTILYWFDTISKPLFMTEWNYLNPLVWQRFFKKCFFSGEVVLISEWSKKEAISRMSSSHLLSADEALAAAEGPAGSVSVKVEKQLCQGNI